MVEWSGLMMKYSLIECGKWCMVCFLWALWCIVVLKQSNEQRMHYICFCFYTGLIKGNLCGFSERGKFSSIGQKRNLAKTDLY